MTDYKFSQACSNEKPPKSSSSVPMRIKTSVLYNSANRNNPHGGVPGDFEIVIDIDDDLEGRPHILERIKQQMH